MTIERALDAVGVDDAHLDARLRILCQPEDAAGTVFLHSYFYLSRVSTEPRAGVPIKLIIGQFHTARRQIHFPRPLRDLVGMVMQPGR